MLLEKISSGVIDPSEIITHRMSLEEAPNGYDVYNRDKDDCIKIVLKPEWNSERPKEVSPH
jgi:S-(hydroxymethyl)glutathione dehydrogenase/alcohol dehydrogenase